MWSPRCMFSPHLVYCSCLFILYLLSVTVSRLKNRSDLLLAYWFPNMSTCSYWIESSAKPKAKSKRNIAVITFLHFSMQLLVYHDQYWYGHIKRLQNFLNYPRWMPLTKIFSRFIDHKKSFEAYNKRLQFLSLCKNDPYSI